MANSAAAAGNNDSFFLRHAIFLAEQIIQVWWQIFLPCPQADATSKDSGRSPQFPDVGSNTSAYENPDGDCNQPERRTVKNAPQAHRFPGGHGDISFYNMPHQKGRIFPDKQPAAEAPDSLPVAFQKDRG